MTKVKTILAEFCSAKDILAMNRLGLLKKEERETQPIPWRHRLNNMERRELVKSEMRMSIRPPSRLNAREMVKAVAEAKSPKDSRMGETLLNIQIRGDPSLGKHLKRINNEQHRKKQGHYQTQHLFLRRSQCLNHEPLILVERPASPNVKTRAMLMKQHGVDPKTVAMPSYMRPLQSRSRTPSTLTTIDAFSVETKKKKNVWEEVMDEKEAPKFKSAARPVSRLTAFEKQQLKIGHSLHKPTQESIAAQAKAMAESQKRKEARRAKSAGAEGEELDDDEVETPPPPSSDLEPSSFFLTQSEHTSKSPHPKPAFTSIAASAGFENGHVSNRKPRSLQFAIDNQVIRSGKTRVGERGLKGSDRRGVPPPRAQTVAGVYASQSQSLSMRPGSESSARLQGKIKQAALPTYTAPKGKERSEKKVTDFLSVLLDAS